jgi:hypothetical protein
MGWDSNSGQYPLSGKPISISTIFDGFKKAGIDTFHFTTPYYGISSFGRPVRYLSTPTNNPSPANSVAVEYTQGNTTSYTWPPEAQISVTANLITAAGPGNTLSLSDFYGKYYLDPTPLVEYYYNGDNLSLNQVITKPRTTRPSPTGFIIEAFGPGGGGGGGGFRYGALGSEQSGGAGSGGTSGEYVKYHHTGLTTIPQLYVYSLGSRGGGASGGGQNGTDGSSSNAISYSIGADNYKIAAAAGLGGYQGGIGTISGAGGNASARTITLFRGGVYINNVNIQTPIAGTSGTGPQGAYGGYGGLVNGILDNNKTPKNGKANQLGVGGQGGQGEGKYGGGNLSGIQGDNGGFIITWLFT